MLRKCLLATIALIGVLILDIPPLVQAQTIVGDFEAELRDWGREDRVQIQLRSRPRNRMGSVVKPEDLIGYDLDNRERGSASAFTLERAAGRMEFKGEWVARRVVEGEFEFVVDEAYPDIMATLGHRRLNDRDLLQAMMFDLSPTYIEALAERGYRRVDWDDLIALRIHGATIDYIDAMAKAGFEPRVKDLIAFRVHGVTPEFVIEMEELVSGRISGSDLLAAAIHGVSPEFVAELVELGYRRLRFDDLVAMRIHGVTVGFIEELAELGYEDVDLDDLVALRIHGVDARYIERVHKKRGARTSIKKLIDLRIHGAIATRAEPSGRTLRARFRQGPHATSGGDLPARTA